MTEYEVTYNVDQKWTSDVPACAPDKEHCYHVPINQTAVYRPRGGWDDFCCWCGVKRQVRSKPTAHGPYAPGFPL